MKISSLVLSLSLLAVTTSLAQAQEAAVPGKSLWGVKLGSSRQQGMAGMKKVTQAKRVSSHTYAGGLVLDEWEIKRGEEFTLFEMLSVKGKITQLRTLTSQGSTSPHTFAQLLKSQPLQKRVYAFIEPEGGGYVSYYYDNLKKGICYTGGTQDMFLLTSKPDGLIVHRPGFRVVPIEGTIRGKVVTGPNAKAYKNAQEAEEANRREMQRR